MLNDEFFREIIFNALINDYKLIKSFSAENFKISVPCPVHFIYGKNDPGIGYFEMSGWKNYFSGNTFWHEMNGAHFHFEEETRKFLDILDEITIGL